MMINKKPGTSWKIASCVIMIAFTVMLFAQPAFATLNTQGNATYMLRGCEVLNDQQVIIFFDKGTFNIDTDMIKIYEGTEPGGAEITVTSMTSYGTPYNVTVSGLAPGTAYTLTTPEDSFEVDEAYTIVVSNTVRANNNLTLGEVLHRQDASLTFVRPDANGDYSATALDEDELMRCYLEFTEDINSDDIRDNVAREGNLYFSLSIPAESPDTVLSGIKLYKWNDGNMQYEECSYADPSSPSEPEDVYEPVRTTQGNFFYIPLSIAGASYQKDLAANTQYKLEIPEIELEDGTTLFNLTGTFYEFNTFEGTGPTKMISTNTPSATEDQGDVDLSWTATSDLTVGGKLCGVAADAYNIYRSTDKYWGFAKINTNPVTGTTYTDDAVPGSGTYYYRLAPIEIINGNSYEGGFSPYAQVAVP